MKKIIILILIFNFSLSFSQSIKSWQNYSNFKNVVQSCELNNSIWTATDGGIFSYSPQDSSFQILTKSNGLLSQNITSISKDKNEKIWIGTNEGYIIIYTPQTGEVKNILEIFKTDKSIKSINNIYISGDTAFVSTAFGLTLVNINDFSFFDSILKFGEFDSQTPVKRVYNGSTLYIITQAGIAYKKAGAINLTAPESWVNLNITVSNNINSLIEFNNNIYAASDRGLLKFSNGSWTQFLFAETKVLDVIAKDQNLYIMLANSVHKFNGTDEEIITETGSVFKSFFIDQQSKIYVSTNKGLLIFDQQKNIFVVPNAPATNSLISLAIDNENNLWSATGKDGAGIGVVKFDQNNQQWSIFNTQNTSSMIINDFHRVNASGNSVYFSTWGRGFVRYKDNLFQRFDANNSNLIGIPKNNTFLVINDIKEDKNGNAWILNYWAADKKPISVLKNDGTILGYELGSPLNSTIISVKDLVIDQFGTKWFSGDIGGDAATEGLFYFNEGETLENLNDDTWGRLTTSNGLRNKDIRDLAIDKFGELIIGTSSGVDVITDPSNPSSLRNDLYFAIRSETINAVAVDAINQKWFGTAKGVFLLSSDGSTLLNNFTTDNSSLPSNNIKDISIDDVNGIIYIGTDFGLSSINTMFIKPNENFSDITVYPNPVEISNSSNNNVIIDGLVEDSEIKILNIAGKVIQEFRSIGGKTTFWNCKDKDGKFVASGIYIIVAYDPEVNQIGHTKLAILRK
ncbi:MAG: T9SS type A sorting domain-containing protein [Ignavibacteriae bacterium]|nr:T9SS type A sorting domain-containing protein [Ignavibacteriota bacterium]